MYSEWIQYLCRDDRKEPYVLLERRRFPRFSRGRLTDPLDPEYFIHGMQYKEVFKPKPSKKYIPENKILLVRDINYPPIETDDGARREFRNTNFIGDIEGVKADTIKHGLISKRITNPLNPVYKALDSGEELENPMGNSIPSEIIIHPTFKPAELRASSNLSQLNPGMRSMRSSSSIHNGNYKDNEYSKSEVLSGSNIRASNLPSRKSKTGSADFESEVKSVRELP